MITRSLKYLTHNKWAIVFIVVLAIILSGAGYSYYRSLKSTNPGSNALQTTTVSTGDIVLSASGIGTLIPNEEVSFGFKNSGKVSEVLVGLGDNVKAGQVLARSESRTLQLQYQQAEANLEALSSPSEIASAEQAVQVADESLAKARNDLQFLIGPDMLIAEERVSNAQNELTTAEAIATKDASNTNQQKVADAKAALAKAQQELDPAYYQYSSNYTMQTFTYPIRNAKGVTVRRELIAPTDAELLARRAAYELAQSNLQDAQNYLEVLKGNKTTEQVPASSISALTEATVARDRAKADLDATALTAPISGTITAINLNPGEDASTSAIVTISDFHQPYRLDVFLDETDWDKAKVGYDASVTFDLLPGQAFSAKLTQVYPVLDSSSGSSMVHVIVQLDGQTNVELPVGASASVDVTGGKALGAVLVPTSALKEVATDNYIVYLIKDGKPVEQEVQIGLQDIVNAEVKSGLRPGDIVLTNAADQK